MPQHKQKAVYNFKYEILRINQWKELKAANIFSFENIYFPNEKKKAGLLSPPQFPYFLDLCPSVSQPSCDYGSILVQLHFPTLLQTGI